MLGRAEFGQGVDVAKSGRIIVEGDLAKLKALLPPAKVEYVEKQPTLEEVLLSIVGTKGA